MSMLDPSTLLPKNPSLPASENYPCYPIDPRNRHSVAWGFILTTQENTAGWLFGHVQFFICAVAFMVTAKFRQPIWKSNAVSIYLGICAAWLVLLLLTGGIETPAVFAGWEYFFGLVPGITFGFRTGLLILFIIDAFVCIYVWEYLVVGKLLPQWGKKRRSKGRVETASNIAMEDSTKAAYIPDAPVERFLDPFESTQASTYFATQLRVGEDDEDDEDEVDAFDYAGLNQVGGSFDQNV